MKFLNFYLLISEPVVLNLLSRIFTFTQFTFLILFTFTRFTFSHLFIYLYVFMRLAMPTYQNLQFWIYLFIFTFVITHFTLSNFYLNNLVTYSEPEVHGFIYHCRNMKFMDFFLYIYLNIWIPRIFIRPEVLTPIVIFG